MPKSPLFHTVASLAGTPYKAADPDTRADTPTPTPEPRQRVTEAEYARAEAAARVVKMARRWRVAKRDGDPNYYYAAQYCLAEAVEAYTALLGKGE